jgi:hypothetical protein
MTDGFTYPTRLRVCEPLGGTAVRELDSPCKLADSAGRTEFMHPTPIEDRVVRAEEPTELQGKCANKRYSQTLNSVSKPPW